MNRNDELEAFKQLNLTQVAAAYGYAVVGRIDPARASSVTMQHDGGDKIVVARSRADGHWIYFSVRDLADSGSVIDFLQRRGVGSLGEVRKTLRPWLGGGGELVRRITPSSYVADLQPIERDVASVRARFEAMDPLLASGHPYLCRDRHLAADLLNAPRFAGRIRSDDRGNAVFPHYNRQGLCGFEMKNRGFTGFAKGGGKGLWASHIAEDDRRLVIAESAIDALSYATLHPAADARFVSLAGQISPEQVELVAAAAAKLPGGEVILAFDNDEGGTSLESTLREALSDTGREVQLHQPAAAGEDWNDVLRARGSAKPALSPGI